MQSPPADTEFQRLLKREIEYKVADTGRTVTLTGQQVIDYLCVRTKSGKTPGKAEIVKFLKLCEARGLDPWVGDAYLVGYDSKDGPQFSLITSEQALLKRAELNEHYDGIQSGLVIKHGKGNLEEREGEISMQGETVIGAWSRVHRKDRSVPTHRQVMMGSYNKGFGVWKTNPNGMLCKVARAAALREAFPKTVGGMYVETEIDMTAASGDPKVVYETPKDKSGLDAIAEKLEQEVCTEASLTVMPDAEPQDLFDKGSPTHE